MKIEIELDPKVAALLAVLDENGDVKNVILTLIDHAQQGVYRPGAWERQWLASVFWEEQWIGKLEGGDPYGREGCEGIFQKPKETSINDDALAVLGAFKKSLKKNFPEQCKKRGIE